MVKNGILCTVLLLLFLTPNPVEAAAPLWEFVSVAPENAAINVSPSVKAARPVSRLLYGKFTEHLWRNIYHGMWAQLVVNPGFEAWRHFGRTEDEAFRHVQSFLAAGRVSELKTGFERGLGMGWLPFGDEAARFERSTDGLNGEWSQKIELTLKGGTAGIMQPVFLPFHRARAYDLRFYVRGKGELECSLRRWPDTNAILARATVESVSDAWRLVHCSLEPQKSFGVVKGEPHALVLTVRGTGTLWLDQVFMFPLDNVAGFDADVVRLIKASRLPLLRYPGGNFVSGYRWKDGIGPVDRRPMRRNPAWHVAEYNHVGTDEFLAFCEAVGCMPLICVNAGDGTPEEAAQWLEYCNGSVATEYGGLRARNGHPEPFNVPYWEIGNELYGSWQIGHTSPEGYAERYEKFYRALKAVDPSVKVIANGQHGRWNAPLIDKKAALLRSLSLHTLIGSGFPGTADPRRVFEGLMGYTTYYEGHLRRLGGQMARTVTPPRLAITELQIFTNKRPLPTNDSLAEALFLSGIINTCMRLDGLVGMITHSALVNHGGGLRKVREIVYANPVHHASHLYATQSGTLPVKMRVATPRYDVSASHVPAVKNVPYLDAAALVDDRGRSLTVIVTNRHAARAFTVPITLHDFTPARRVAVRSITGTSYMARNTWAAPDVVSLVTSELPISGRTVRVPFPPHSITELCFERTGD